MTTETLNAVPPADVMTPPVLSKNVQPFGRSIKFLLAMLVTYFLAAFLYVVGAGIYIAATQPDLPQAEIEAWINEHMLSPNGITWMYLVTAIPVLLVLFKAARMPQQSWTQTLALTPVAAKRYVPWLGAFALYYVSASLVNWLWPVASGEFIEAMLGVRHLGLFVIMVLVAPVVEELVFRGYFFQAWRNSFLGVWGTLLLTSVLFTLIHAGQYPLIILAMLFSFSVILGLAREKTGSTYVPMVMHAINNLLAFILINWLGYV